MKKKIKILIVVASVLLLLALLLIYIYKEMKEDGKQIPTSLEELTDIPETTTLITEEEYLFYYQIVERDFQDRSQTEEIDAAAIQYASEVYGQSALGVSLDLCQPYSFERLKSDMEYENKLRKLKKETSEVYYGPDEFTLETYFRYKQDELKSQLIEWIAEHADAKMTEAAKEYSEGHPELFETLESVEYETDVSGEVKTEVIERTEMSALETTNSVLFEFLYTGEEGESFTDPNGDEDIHVKIVSKTKSRMTMEENAAYILKIYIQEEVYDQLLEQLGEHNPVTTDM